MRRGSKKEVKWEIFLREKWHVEGLLYLFQCAFAVFDLAVNLRSFSGCSRCSRLCGQRALSCLQYIMQFCGHFLNKEGQELGAGGGRQMEGFYNSNFGDHLEPVG